MINDFFAIQEFLNNDIIKIANKKIHHLIQNYSFVHATEKIDNQNKEIYQNLRNSKIMIVTQNDISNHEVKEQFFLIGFKKTIIIVEKSSLSYLYPLLSSTSDLTICFLSNTKLIFDENITIKYKESKLNQYYDDEITNFHQKLMISCKRALKYHQYSNQYFFVFLAF